MDELRALRHQRALELLEEPGMRETFRKDFNLTALKEWEEAREPFEEDEEILAYLKFMKNEAHKNGTDSANSGSADGVTRQGSNGTGRRSSINGGKQKVWDSSQQQSEDQEGKPSIFLTEMLNSLRTFDFLDVYIKRNLEVNIRKFAEGELNLNPPIQPNDLVHKSPCLYVLVLPECYHLMLWHIRGRLFRAIAFYDNHDEYVEFLDIFYSNYKSSI
ncbi:hypothetical protein C1646_764880 [Rhizophagus diaphanus]|nr:hypothetical protein C1646_764880 [Rhizophagus diaphanus] [Rhizophagus sp. MUCL 43196]